MAFGTGAMLYAGENLSLSMLVGHTQATAADLLRTLGLERARAHELVGQAALRGQRDPRQHGADNRF